MSVRNALVLIGRLGLGLMWLVSGVAYIVTPPLMEQRLGLSAGVRIELGILMTLFALLLFAGTFMRKFRVVVGSLVAMLLGGCLFAAYDLARHWTTFFYFHGLLALLAACLLLWRPKPR